jgi:hypothetical protein
MQLRPWSLAVVMALAACGEGSSGVPGPSMSVATLGLVSGMKVTRDGRVFGQDVELLRTEDGYRGVVRGLPLDLHASPGRVFGHVGIQPVDLHVTRDAEELRARGLYAGQLGRLELGPDHLQCTLGPCAYALKRVSETTRLEGERACVLPRDWRVPRFLPAQVELPPGFGQMRPERQAMLLVLLLGGTPVRELVARPSAGEEENPRPPRFMPMPIGVVVPKRRR